MFCIFISRISYDEPGILLKQFRRSVSRSLTGIYRAHQENSLFAGYDDAAQNDGVVASLIQTCRLHGVDPSAYLTDILKRGGNLWRNSRIDELFTSPSTVELVFKDRSDVPEV